MEVPRTISQEEKKFTSHSKFPAPCSLTAADSLLGSQQLFPAPCLGILQGHRWGKKQQRVWVVTLSSQHWHKMSLLRSKMCFLSCLRTLVVFLRCFAGLFSAFPLVFESSTGLENALKNCSCTCFSILAPRQENVDGETLGNNSPGNRSRSPAQHQWEQLSCRDGKTHGSAELENGG